jgi:hypothetical protein
MRRPSGARRKSTNPLSPSRCVIGEREVLTHRKPILKAGILRDRSPSGGDFAKIAATVVFSSGELAILEILPNGGTARTERWRCCRPRTRRHCHRPGRTSKTDNDGLRALWQASGFRLLLSEVGSSCWFSRSAEVSADRLLADWTARGRWMGSRNDAAYGPAIHC